MLQYIAHPSNHVLLYASAVMRGCLARKKYKCLKEEKDSKASHRKVIHVRNNVSQARMYHVSSLQMIYISQYYVILPHLPSCLLL
jgi:hypothetical protein